MSADGVAAVLVNWNSAADVTRVVDTIRNEYPGLATIVVDNDSEGSDWPVLERLAADGVFLDRLPTNRGYAAGVNRGLHLAKGRGYEWVWLLNPDALPYPRCLDLLMEHAGGGGLLSPQQLSSSEPFGEGASPYVSAARYRGSRLVHERCQGCAVGQHSVDLVTGTGLLVNVEAAHAVGLMDERFFHYKEEFEFAERVAEVSEVRYVCCARLWHQRGGSMSQESPRASYYRVRNELLYLSLRLGPSWRVRGRTLRWIGRSTVEASRAPSDMRRAMVRGMVDGLRGRWGKVA